MSPKTLIDLASVSDLHLDHRSNWLVAEAMAYKLIEESPDVLILAGDLASLPTRVEQALRFFRPLAPYVVFVPGNHDLWAPTAEERKLAEVNTWVTYREEMPALCAKLGIHYLPTAPLLLGDAALVGTTGWYDYSLASPLARLLHKETDFAAKEKGTARWTDGWRVRFRDADGQVMTDPAVARVMEADLAAQLAGLPPAVRKVVAVTHHLPFREVSRSHGGLAGDYFTAFMGSPRLGEILSADPRVELAIYGHIHRSGDTRVGRIRVVATPLGNPRDWKGEPAEAAVRHIGRWQV